MEKRDDIQKAGDVLKELFSHLNFNEGQTYVSFFSDWMDLVGVDLACHIRPIDIRRNSLLLEVDHPGWMQIFQLKQKRILQRIQKKHPSLGITSVHYRLKSTTEEPFQKKPFIENSSPSGMRSTSLEKSDPEVNSSEKITTENERLRKALEKLEKQIKKRAKEGY